jgi:HAMP domain-containing protein
VVSVTLFPQPAVVPRAHYERVRRLLVIALVIIVGLTYAVVALATTKNTTVLQRPTRAVHYFDLSRRFADCIATAEPGERLDHRGRENPRSTSLNAPATMPGFRAGVAPRNKGQPTPRTRRQLTRSSPSCARLAVIGTAIA